LPHVKTSLCPVAFSNFGATCSSTGLSALELITLISSAFAEMPATSIVADANTAAAVLLGVISLMALLPDCNRETLLQAIACQDSTSVGRMQFANGSSRA
jgi:hypothetical protein